ncbi:integrase core domain protein [Peptoniphilus duerdenii ATCC BAA-1640]|uniref:Integrase core domain protein n=2 Tax=Peptoniphilus TaxID=162289 RepID=E0NIL4_9FIRM|nr:integrase core domain protein [Peptoniphilus duerdenii ATCC BAA-1640]
MCKILGITRSLIYYHLDKEKEQEQKPLEQEEQIEKEIKEIFRKSKNNYGTRKIKVELENKGYQVSRRKISRIMRENKLVSNYAVKEYKVEKTVSNESKIENKIDRQFNEREKLEAIVSDLTYVKVGNNWNYICTIIDLHNREIIGYAAGSKKDANLVKEAIYNIKEPLNKIKIFHTDRGKEYDNKKIEEILKTFGIERSLSKKGSPYDNAVAETINKAMKTEFIYQRKFRNLKQLQQELAEYVYWYNNIRLHGSLGYMSPRKYRELELISTNK